MTIDQQLAELREAATPDWVIYGEPDVGLPPSLFAGTPGHTGFGPLEPLSGVDLTLAAMAPALLDETLRLREREKALVGALEPFAEVADWAQRNGHDLLNFDMLLRNAATGYFSGHLQAQSEDFIRARAALSQHQQEG